MVNADLRHGTTAEERGKLLTEHLRTLTGHTMPNSITCAAVFATNHFSQYRPIVLVSFQLRCKGMFKQNMQQCLLQ